MPDLPPGVARRHATTKVPIAQLDQTVEEIRTELATGRFDFVGEVVVLAGNSLAGLVPIERLLAAEDGTRVADLMNASPPIVTPTTDQQAVAWEMVRRGGSCATVVDSAGEFIGLVPPSRMLGVLLAEHDEDLARLGGYLTQTQSARSAAEETILRRLWHRLPWLLLGLAGAMLAAIVVGGFEEQLDKTVLLAFFLPAVV